MFTLLPLLLLPLLLLPLLLLPPSPPSPLLPSPLSGDEDSLWYGDIYAVVVGNPRKLSARDSSHSLHRPEAQEFTLYALRSVPGTPGLLKEVTFKCPSAEVCQNWSDQIYYRTQSKGGGGGGGGMCMRRGWSLFRSYGVYTPHAYMCVQTCKHAHTELEY